MKQTIVTTYYILLAVVSAGIAVHTLFLSSVQVHYQDQLQFLHNQKSALKKEYVLLASQTTHTVFTNQIESRAVALGFQKTRVTAALSGSVLVAQR